MWSASHAGRCVHSARRRNAMLRQRSERPGTPLVAIRADPTKTPGTLAVRVRACLGPLPRPGPSWTVANRAARARSPRVTGPCRPCRCGRRGDTNRAAFPDPPSNALRASADFAVEGAGYATKGVVFSDPRSGAPVPTTQADSEDNKGRHDLRGSSDDSGRRESLAASSHPRAHQPDHRYNRFVRHAGPRQNPEVRFPERTWPRNNRQVRHPSATPIGYRNEANGGRTGKSATLRTTVGRGYPDLACVVEHRRRGPVPPSSPRAIAESKTTAPCRKPLPWPGVAARAPENR
jgi:hypothetical protein